MAFKLLGQVGFLYHFEIYTCQREGSDASTHSKETPTTPPSAIQPPKATLYTGTLKCSIVLDLPQDKRVVFYLGILWYPIWSKMISFLGGIVFYNIRNITFLGSTAKKNATQEACSASVLFLGVALGEGFCSGVHVGQRARGPALQVPCLSRPPSKAVGGLRKLFGPTLYNPYISLYNPI